MKRKHLALALLILFINSFSFLFAQQNKTNEKIVNIKTNIQNDATYTILRNIQAIKKNQSAKIIFEKGVYHFYPEHAFEKFCYISNHNDVLARIAFPIIDKSNITIDGNGSKFIFHGRMIPFLVENSKDIKVENLTVDFSDTFHSEGTIVAVNNEEKTFDMAISKEYPYEIRNNQLIFIKPYYEHTLGQSILYDPTTKAIAYQTEQYTPITTIRKSKIRTGITNFEYKYKTDKNDDYIRRQGKEFQLTVKELKPGLVRVYGHKKKLPSVGLILASKGEQGENRFAPAFKSNHVTNFSAENVIVNHAGGMGFLFEDCENVDLYKCSIEPSNGRMVSTTADATHFVGCRGNVSLRNCVFHNQLDDAMNVHGAYQEVMDKLDKYSVGVRVGHFQQLGTKIGRPGDTIGLVNLKDSFNAYGTLTIKSVDFINGRYMRVRFNEEIPSQLSVGHLLENLTAYPKVLVENCDISRNRARGLLISTPKGTIVRNNYFSTEMNAILLPVESGSWFESGNAENVVIENNTFEDCCLGVINRGVIAFDTDEDSDKPAFRNIKIENNTFNQYDNLIMEVTNVDGLLFKGNKIFKTNKYEAITPTNPAIRVQRSKNVEFKSNTYKGKASQVLLSLDGDKTLKFK